MYFTDYRNRADQLGVFTASMINQSYAMQPFGKAKCRDNVLARSGILGGQ
jgi:hypothetical protein